MRDQGERAQKLYTDKCPLSQFTSLVEGPCVTQCARAPQLLIEGTLSWSTLNIMIKD